MEEQAIINIVKSYISQSLQNLNKENNKFDFKRQWYDLTSQHNISEFLKDITAIANTFGIDGFIVIGFDEKLKEFHNSIFPDCGLKDKSQLADLINRNVDRLFHFDELDVDIDGHFLSVIHIPPSIDKPHVIKNYKKIDKLGNEKLETQRIFVRNASGTQIASKNDIELMYYDRKNIVPEFKLIMSCNLNGIKFGLYNNETISLLLDPSIENVGLRPVAISQIKIKVAHLYDEEQEKIIFKSTERSLTNKIIIRSGDIFNQRIELYIDSCKR